MARPKAKTTAETDGRQGRSLAPTKAPMQQGKDRQTLSHEQGNGAAIDDSRTRIEKLAYELYQRRGCMDGHDREDWLEAERLLVLAQPTGVGQEGAGHHPTSSPA